jgi:transcription initiation factor TFIIF subunit alpha
MSASPSVQPSGPTPPNGPGGPKIIRKKKNDNPLVAPKRRPNPQARSNLLPRPPPKPATNGATRKDSPADRLIRRSPDRVLLEQLRPIIDPLGDLASGFNDPTLKEGDYEDYELWTTKRELREGFRYHLARFVSKKKIDPRKEDDFQRPVRLHRRDPRSKAPEKMEENGKTEVNGIDDKDKEIEEWKAKREEEREANLAQIAPDVITGQKRKKITQQKTAEVHGIRQTEEQKAKSILRYEEALPWHLEDFDNKSVWVGNYEEAMSGVHAVLAFQGSKIIMTPVEKWYKFTRKDLFKTMTIDEVETSMKKRVKEPRWMMEHRQREEELKEQNVFTRRNKGLFVGKEAREGGKGRSGRKYDEDADEIDADGADEFADDEEDALFEADEEEYKEIERRIKKDQLQANIFDLKEEKEYEEEELLEKKLKEAERILGAATRKALKKREKRHIYHSDRSDDNPFSESSSSTDSDEERAKEALARQVEAERKAKEKANQKPNQPPSGTSTKGTNTPSGRPKHIDPLKVKNKLKRPGSPDLSELSGTDTSRKKLKKKHAATGTSTPQPGSRPMSPAFSTATAAANTSSQPQPRKSSVIKLNVDPSKLQSSSQPLPKKRTYGAGSGSDGEAGTAGSGQEMSDGGTTVKKRLKLNLPGQKSPKGTPVGSRAGSPKPTQKPSGNSFSSPSPPSK